MKRKIWITLPTMLLITAWSAYPGVVTGKVPVTAKLKKENPGQLYFAYYQYRECPFTVPSIESMIEGLFVRSRLKRTSFEEWKYKPNMFYLSVEVYCDKDGNPPYVYLVDTKFRELVTLERQLVPMKVLMDHRPGYER